MRTTIAVTFCAALLMGIAAGQQAPSTEGKTLADIANEKKAKPAKKHVITNEDIPARADDSGSGSSGGTTFGSASAAPGSGTPAADARSGDAKDDSAKKPADADKISAAQTKLDNLKHDEQVYSNGVKKIEDMIASGSDFRRNMLADTLQQQKNSLAETQKKRQTAETELDKLKNPKKQ